MSKLLDVEETVECHKHVQDLNAIGNSRYRNMFKTLNIDLHTPIYPIMNMNNVL